MLIQEQERRETSMKVTNENFEQIISRGTVVLDFWAPWCAPCRALTPIIEEVSEKNPNIVFGSVNVDEENELAYKFNISSIPYVVKLVDGKVVDSFLGYRNIDEVEEFFK